MFYEHMVIEQRAHEHQREMILEAQRNSILNKVRNALRELAKHDTR